jgi:hypothetical protein
MTVEELKKWIPRRLGAPYLSVPLSPEHLDDAVTAARDWFIAKKGVEKQTQFILNSSTTIYTMPDDCDVVLDVIVEDSPLDISLIFSPQLLADEKVPYSVFAPPSSTAGGLYSSFVQALQYTEMAKQVIGADINWQYNQYNKQLLILPPTLNALTALIQYKSSEIGALDQLPERDHDLFKRFALAWAKRDLGNIYSRYSSWQVAEGQQVLNGAQLIEESKLEFATLEEEIFNSAKPAFMVVG